MYPIVALAVATGARRNEILAPRWTDLDVDNSTLRTGRTWEPTKKSGFRLKMPEIERGIRTISTDQGTIAVRLEWKGRLQRIVAGIPNGVAVAPSMIKLPQDASLFPGILAPGTSFDFAKPMTPINVTKEFARRRCLPSSSAFPSDGYTN